MAKMKMTLQGEHSDSIRRALERCQFIEETLRIYLDLVIKVAQIKLSSHFPINITTKDLSKFPLGKLVKKFEQFNDNKSLHANLKQITPDRNFVAHQSMLLTLGELEDEGVLKEHIRKIEEIERRAKAVHEELLEERYKMHRCLRAIQKK